MRVALGLALLSSIAACNALIDHASDFTASGAPASCDAGACADGAASVSFAPDPNAPWPMVGGNAGHTGFARVEGHQLKGKERWRDTPVTFPSPPAGEPVVDADGAAYLVTSNATLYAIAPDGRVRWSANLGGTSIGSPALAGSDRLYVTSSSEGLRAFSRDGKPVWDRGAGVGRGSPVVASDGRVLVVDAKLHAVTPEGEVAWSYDLGGSAPAKDVPVAIDESGVIVAVRDRVHAVSPAGEKLWGSADGDRLAPMPVVSAGVAYVGVGSAIAAIETNEGVTQWKANLGGPRLLARPAIGQGGLLYLLAGRDLVTMTGGRGTGDGTFNIERAEVDVTRPPAPVMARIGDFEIAYAAAATSEAVSITGFRLSQNVGSRAVGFNVEVAGMAFGPNGSLYVAVAAPSGDSSLIVLDR